MRTGPPASSADVTVRVCYLSAIQERSGARRDELRLPPGSSLGEVAAWVRDHRGIELPGPSVLATLNGHGWSRLPGGMATEMHDGDEVSLFPLSDGG